MARGTVSFFSIAILKEDKYPVRIIEDNYWGSKHYQLQVYFYLRESEKNCQTGLGRRNALGRNRWDGIFRIYRHGKLKVDRKLNLEIQLRWSPKLLPLQMAYLKEVQFLFTKWPGLMQQADTPFYLDINHIHLKLCSFLQQWFKWNTMGVNLLNSLIKCMAEKAGLGSQGLTNHSGRKTWNGYPMATNSHHADIRT